MKASRVLKMRRPLLRELYSIHLREALPSSLDASTLVHTEHLLRAHQTWLSWDLAVGGVTNQVPNLTVDICSEQVANAFFAEHPQAAFLRPNCGGSNHTEHGPLALNPDRTPLPGEVIATTTGSSKPNSTASHKNSLLLRNPSAQTPSPPTGFQSQSQSLSLRFPTLLGTSIDFGRWPSNRLDDASASLLIS